MSTMTEGKGDTVPPISDPTRGSSEPKRFWTTANVGEAAPDVMTPMCWALWGWGNEVAVRRCYYSFGIINKGDVYHELDPNKRITACFYGRVAMNMDLLRVWMSRLPGVSADDFELGMAGSVRPDATPVPSSKARVPLITAKAGLQSL